MATQQEGDGQYLSFNTKISPNMATYQTPSPAELEEMKSKDPALRYTWSIWEQIMQNTDNRSQQYSDNTHRVASFSTVKGFWKYWNHLPQPSELVDGKKFVRQTVESKNTVDALMLFRDGIKPEWEDPANATGGHFLFQLKANLGGGVIDEYWNNIILGIIGGTVEPTDMITGARLVDKMGQNARNASVRIEVWFTNFEDTEKVDLLQRNLEKCMTRRLDGSSSEKSWGKTDRKSHIVKK
jgi:translation initiation factor 4E